MTDFHQFQIDQCKEALRPILNLGCMHDPAYLGRDFGAINADVRQHDKHTNTDLRTLPNFVHCTAFKTPFASGFFKTVVLGEFLEHCTWDAAVKVMRECFRVLVPGGTLILTFPLDDRPKEIQHEKELLVEWSTGITSWHQTVWENEIFDKLLEASGFKSHMQKHIFYGFCLRNGKGVVAKKGAKTWQ